MKHICDCGCSFKIDEERVRKKGKELKWYYDNQLIPPIHLDINNINMNCHKVWHMLGQGLTKGVFQLESGLGRQWCKRLKPESIEHLSALGAILRPGCMKALDEKGVSTTERYCRRKNLEEPVTYYHPALEPVLKKTYGEMIFQEQAMEAARVIAGFNLQDADVLRKAIGKKLPEEMAKCKTMFIEGAAKTKVVTEEQARVIFEGIEKSQRYSFNKCIHKDTVIKRATKGKYLKGDGYTVEHMYKVRNFIEYAKSCGQLSLYKKWKLIKNYGKGLSLCEDGRVRPNDIIDIQPAGKQKVYKVTLKNLSTISVTMNHKFPTPNGIKKLEELSVGDLLYICGEYEITDFTKINKFSSTTIEELRIKQLEEHDGTVGFMSGINNPGYTNGSYSDFKKCKESMERKCSICGTTEGRLEFHHKNKDRTNSKEDNVECLCVSCHKKEDYKLGRTRRGEKGYPIIETEIISIEYDDEVDTYDVTMDAPNHNFVVSGNIITCNSHSTAYAINGYWSAFCKAHFPVQFFTSYLRFSEEKQKPLQEIKELVQEAKKMNIEVYTPDITAMRSHFYTDGKVIHFGLTDVKNVGEAQVKKLRQAVATAEALYNKKLEDMVWYEFLVLVSDKVSSRVIENLISVGAMKKIHENTVKNQNDRRVSKMDGFDEHGEKMDNFKVQSFLFS